MSFSFDNNTIKEPMCLNRSSLFAKDTLKSDTIQIINNEVDEAFVILGIIKVKGQG